MRHRRDNYTTIAMALFLMLAIGLPTACGGPSSTTVPAAPRTSSPTSLGSATQEQDAPAPCQPKATATFACLTFTGSGVATSIGKLALMRDAIVFAALNSNNCHPVSSTGHLAAADHDLIYFTAPGVYCPASDTASYTYTITGGTGIYKGAKGTGRITVQAATASTNGVETRTEMWSGTMWSGTLIYSGRP